MVYYQGRQRSPHFFLHQHASLSQHASARCDGIARKVCLVDWMLKVATYYGLKAAVGVSYGLCDEKVVQEVHGRTQIFNVNKLICKNTQKTNTAKKGFC